MCTLYTRVPLVISAVMFVVLAGVGYGIQMLTYIFTSFKHDYFLYHAICFQRTPLRPLLIAGSMNMG